MGSTPNVFKIQLVKEYKYPTELRLVDYDPEFAIRGLWFDTTTALLMKFTFSNKMSDNYGIFFLFFWLEGSKLISFPVKFIEVEDSCQKMRFCPFMMLPSFRFLFLSFVFFFLLLILIFFL